VEVTETFAVPLNFKDLDFDLEEIEKRVSYKTKCFLAIQQSNWQNASGKSKLLIL